MSRRGIIGLKTRGPDCIHVGGVRGGSHSVTSGDTAAPRVLNLEKESCEHLRWTHLEQVQRCIDLPHQVTFPSHSEQGKIGPGLE